MKYIIRPCIAGDLDKVIELCDRHAAFEGFEYERQGKAHQLARILFNNNPPIRCWVVEVECIVVGYCSFTIEHSTWEAAPFLHMDCLYVEEPYRGFGIGSAILSKLRVEAQLIGCKTMQWQTPSDNIDAIAFYKKIGATARQKERFSWNVS